MAADPEPPAELTDAQQRAIPGKVHADILQSLDKHLTE